MIAGALEIQMLANLARLADDMQKAKSMVGGAMGNIEKAVSSAKTMLASLGIGLSAGYFATLIKGSIDAADHLNDLTKSTGLAVEQLAGLQLASKQSGGDLESIAASLNKLSQNMGKETEKFKALGVSAKDPLEAFKQLSDVFVAIKDPQLRAAVAAEALGKSWAGAAPLLAEGSAKIQEMVDKGMRLSGVTKENAEQADKFNDQMAELNTTLGATRTKLVGEFLPGMNEIAGAMAEAAKEGGLLLTVWVGLGGAMTHLLGLSDAQMLRARLEEINYGLKVSREQLQSGGLNENTLAQIRETVAALEKEKAALTQPEASKELDANFKRQQAQLAAIAAERAKAFVAGKDATDKAEQERLRALQEANRLTEGWAKAQRKRQEDDAAAEKERLGRNFAENQKAVEAANKLGEEWDARQRKRQEETAEWAIMRAGEVWKANQKVTGEITEFWRAAAQSMQRSMSDFFFDIMQGKLTDLGASFKRTLDRMVADNLAAQAATALFGKEFGKGGAMGGWVGDVIDKMSGKAPAFGGIDMGGGLTWSGEYATGTDYVPQTGLALVHEGERIIPASENKMGAGGSSVRVEVINPPGMPTEAADTQVRFDPEGMVVSVFLKDMRNNGPIAQTMSRAASGGFKG